jgi:hypothetical protein
MTVETRVPTTAFHLVCIKLHIAWFFAVIFYVALWTRDPVLAKSLAAMFKIFLGERIINPSL